MNTLYTCSYRCRDFAGNNLLPMILSTSAFNSCMIEFSIPDCNETIIKNTISLFLSVSNTERRKVVFRTQWFIGQYCSERGERVPLSLNISRPRRERTFIAVLHFHFMTLFVTAFYDCIAQTPGKRTWFLTSSKITGSKVRFFYSCYYYYTVCFISSFSQCPTMGKINLYFQISKINGRCKFSCLFK